MSQTELPGTRPREKAGRNRRSLDAYVKVLRKETPDTTGVFSVRVTALRDLADSLDRLKADRDRSEHTVAIVARTYLERLLEIVPATGGPVDPLRDLADAMNDATANSSIPDS
jgi:hypothetical protein